VGAASAAIECHLTILNFANPSATAPQVVHHENVLFCARFIINNAIVLINRIKIEIDDLGKPPAEAVVAACLQRFRPVMLTTGTTVLGMMPLWWGGTAMLKPLAISIILGLLFATLLTLLVVPVLYAVLFRVAPPPKPPTVAPVEIEAADQAEIGAVRIAPPIYPLRGTRST